jgi:hypothetical protein
VPKQPQRHAGDGLFAVARVRVSVGEHGETEADSMTLEPRGLVGKDQRAEPTRLEVLTVAAGHRCRGGTQVSMSRKNSAMSAAVTRVVIHAPVA